MSGGSYGYIYGRLEEECNGRMYDAEMDDMIKDLCEVLHDLEWWKSSDSSEDKYRTTLAKFKTKWLKGNRKERLKGYIDEQVGIVREQLYALIGEPTVAESKHSTIEELKQEPFINKPCVSSGVCKHDKNEVLNKIRAELIQSIKNGTLKIESGNEELFRIIDKYKEESEDKE